MWGRQLLAIVAVVGTMGLSVGIYGAYGSDHLDTPTVIADPAADIGDVYAWMAGDGRRVNLVMTIIAHRFSDRLLYVFHVGSGKQLSETSETTSIVCRFDASGVAECWVGNADYARGDASIASGIEGRNGKFRVFAGLRDDPFFNNVKGTRTALQTAAAALRSGASVDSAGYPSFGQTTLRTILDQWRHTDGGPGQNFLAGWKVSALVIAVDLDVVSTGGNLLAVWAAVHKATR